MTAAYWEIGRRIVTLEQRGEQRAEYGEQLIERLAGDLTRQFGRGFGVRTSDRCAPFTCMARATNSPDTVWRIF